jgi:hypothetical protein
VRDEIELYIDRVVTVILGPNDHGKSNILRALTHLNLKNSFDPEWDPNWDTPDPHISFDLLLSATDRADLESRQAGHETSATAAPGASQEEEDTTVQGVEDEGEDKGAAESTSKRQTPGFESDSPDATDTTPGRAPETLRVRRDGPKGALTYVEPRGFAHEVIVDFIQAKLPRVELFEPQPTLKDSVTAATIASADQEFMRGIFYYAGINARSCEDLFKQTDETDMRLTEASASLNDTLSNSWKQREGLQFRLAHRDGISIELQIRDPSVKQRYVRASRRSAGFTHFFTLKTILHARQVENPAESYIYLFDEPGMFLHPSGQHDLMRVMEAIGRQDQVVYSTHSLFMVNRTFPLRHRLVSKDNSGTRINAKPYSGRWGATLSSLGVSLSATIMFSDYVLLTEGDSEAIVIPAIMQRLMASGVADIDLNAFAVLASGDARDTQALLRVLIDSASAPSLAVLVDGDDGGKSRLKALKNVLSTRPTVRSGSLVEGTTIEDYLPYLHELYPEAVVRHCANARIDSGKLGIDLEQAIQEHRDLFAARFAVGKVTSDVARWGSEVGEKIIGDGKPSKVGIAREYIALLDQKDVGEPEPTGMKRPKRLLSIILELLTLPRLADVPDTVLVEAEETA